MKYLAIPIHAIRILLENVSTERIALAAISIVVIVYGLIKLIAALS